MKDFEYLIDIDPRNTEIITTEVLVLGSGIAGLFTAIKLCDSFEVTVLTKKDLMASSTEHAQGGIAVALNQDDSPEFHFADTINAGADLCNTEGVRILTEKGPECVRELIELGVEFDKKEGKLDFVKEAAHSRRRILHAKGDATGWEIERTLANVVRKRNIEIKENHFVIDFLKNAQGHVCGVVVLDCESSKLKIWLARAIVVATGGLGQLYRYTTNPEVATGDGIAAAYRAGAELMDMEFVQFHPTALNIPGAPTFLISEAARGEGAVLINSEGKRFMEDIAGQELAPRDVVARANWREMEKGPVYLDFRGLGINKIKERFPGIYKTCLNYGIDITKTAVPVGPAAHYLMGGIKIDISGRTSLPNLFACGECACSGLHGANRLASNSLLEGLVFASLITETLKKEIGPKPAIENLQIPAERQRKERESSSGTAPDSTEIRRKIQEIMWHYVGIIRDRQGLLKAQTEIEKYWQEFSPGLKVADLETANMLILALLIIQAALAREESRGGHFRSDFPTAEAKWQKHSVLKKGEKIVRFISI